MDASVAGLIGVIVGTVISLAGTICTTRATLNAAKRERKVGYLTGKMDLLVSALAEYEEYLAQYQNYRDGDPVLHARIIGKAISACLAVSDMPTENDISDAGINKPDDIPEVPDSLPETVHKVHRLAYIANRRLTRNFVNNHDWDEVKKWGVYQDRNRTALDHAVKRLALLIADAQK